MMGFIYMHKDNVLNSDSAPTHSRLKSGGVSTRLLPHHFFPLKIVWQISETTPENEHLPQEAGPSMAFNPCKSLEIGIQSLLNSEKYSDLTITTQNRSFQVHKAIVCTQSKVLAAMSDSGFKGSSTAILPLDHDDPATIERMVTFLYTGGYDQGSPVITVKDAELFVGPIPAANALVYSIADKYEIEDLKALAKVKFETFAFAAWDCKDFPAIVAQVFDTTPESDLGLRDVVSLICAKHVDEVLTSEVWSDLLTDNGAIGLSILKSARQRSVEEVQKAEDELKANEQEFDWLISCNDRLHKRFDEAHEDLESMVDKWGERKGDEACNVCEDSLFEALKRDLAEFKKALPKSAGSVFL